VALSTVLLLAAEGAETVTKEASNPILPTSNELFWGGLTFCLLWALMKFVFLPPVVRIMKERNDKVRDDLAAAEEAKARADADLAGYEQNLVTARAEGSRLIDDARAQADAVRKETLGAAEAEVATQRQTAAAEIAAAKTAALAELRGGVASIAVGAAETIVSKPLDQAAQMQVIEAYVNSAGSKN